MRKYPDLVLHTSQGNDKVQKMICEIKCRRTSSKDQTIDLLKLILYTKYGFYGYKPFEYAIFVLVGKGVRLET